ncbi:amino acid permease C-terminal domain-containing protein [Bacillus cereus]
MIGICFSLYLIISLPEVTWIRFIIWMLIGLVIYIIWKNQK